METCLSCRRAGYFYVSERDFPAGFSSDLRRGFYDLTCNLDGLLLYRTWKIDTGRRLVGSEDNACMQRRKGAEDVDKKERHD